mgnify:CR=1 FL=1
MSSVGVSRNLLGGRPLLVNGTESRVPVGAEDVPVQGPARARVWSAFADQEVDQDLSEARADGWRGHPVSSVSSLPQPFPFPNNTTEFGGNKNPLIHTTENEGAKLLRSQFLTTACPAEHLCACCGPKGIRTLDLFNAIEALSQLSYRPLLYNKVGFKRKQYAGMLLYRSGL